MKLRLEVVEDLRRVDADRWDALSGDDDPFSEHAFLSALEQSGSVGGDSGWHPRHLLAFRDEDDGNARDEPIAALPLYEKHHSYGEYIFDFAWANAPPFGRGCPTTPSSPR